MGISVFLLFILIVFNGFFAGSEIAFISLKEQNLKALVAEGDKKAASVLKLKEIPNKFLSTIQIGVSLASILSGVFAAEAFASLLTDWILLLVDFPISAVKTFSMFFITLITSYLMLLFGELVPKRIAMAHPQKFAYLAVYPLTALAIITTPVVKLLSISTNFILRTIGINPEKIREAVTEEEIRNMVEAGEISPIEKEMIENIFKFDDMRATEVMTHRTDVIAIDSDESLDHILELINEERYTRYPVYKDNIDNIIGIIHLRELLRYLSIGKKEDFEINNFITEPYFVPDSKKADELFRELQIHQTHMGIIIDEYGGTAGVVTMENLIEEIMGEIADEYDADSKEAKIMKLENNKYLVDGACDVDDLEEILQIGLPTEDYDTINGFIIGRLGRIPIKDDLTNQDSDFIFNGYLFKIIAIDEKVITKVKVSKQLVHEDVIEIEE